MGLGLVLGCSEEPVESQKAGLSSQTAPQDGGFGDMSGLPDPCGTAGASMNPLGNMNPGAAPIMALEGYNQPNNQPIPGMISGRVPTGGEQEMDSPAPCGEQQAGAGPQEDEYVYQPGIETDLKNCTDSGKFFNVNRNTCTNESLASWECSEDAVLDPSFKKIPAELKDTLRQELSGRFSGMRLYACLDAPNGGLELHFYKRTSNREITWDFWILYY